MRLSSILLTLVLLAACTTEGDDRADASEDVAWPVEEQAGTTPQPREEPDPLALETARSCLAMALYHEARGESEEGMAAVGHVILNRKADPEFPRTVCGVVKDGGETPPCQFSWWCDGRPDDPAEIEAWEQALSVAERILSGELADPTTGAIYFYAGSKPGWADAFTETARVGPHIFLTK